MFPFVTLQVALRVGEACTIGKFVAQPIFLLTVNVPKGVNFRLRHTVSILLKRAKPFDFTNLLVGQGLQYKTFPVVTLRTVGETTLRLLALSNLLLLVRGPSVNIVTCGVLTLKLRPNDWPNTVSPLRTSLPATEEVTLWIGTRFAIKVIWKLLPTRTTSDPELPFRCRLTHLARLGKVNFLDRTARPPTGVAITILTKFLSNLLTVPLSVFKVVPLVLGLGPENLIPILLLA